MTSGEAGSERSRLENQVLDQLERGEQVDIERHCREHPEQAEGLRNLVRARRFLDRGDDPEHDDQLDQLDGLLDGYEIVRLLGKGGMGRVYLARQCSLRGRLVAIKVMHPALTDQPNHRERFRREAELAATLSHQGIARVFESGEVAGVLYYVMEFIPGRSLDEVLREIWQGLPTGRPASPKALDRDPTILGRALLAAGSSNHRSGGYIRSATRIVMEVAEAIGYAHRAETPQLHRDLKPGNIMLRLNEETGSCDHPVVLDFGLARPADDSCLTTPDDILGTREFVSPEQYDDPRSATSRSDVFCLGTVLHDLLSLADPAGRGPARRGLDPIRKLNPGVGRNLAAIVSKATELNARFRYLDARDLADDLARFLADLPVHARAYSPIGWIRSWVGRHPSAATISLLVGLLGLLAGYFAVVITSRVTEQEEALPRIFELDRSGRFAAAKAEIDHYAAVAEAWPLVTLHPNLRRLWESYEVEPRKTAVRMLEPFRGTDVVRLDGSAKWELLLSLAPLVRPSRILFGQGTDHLCLFADLMARGENDLVKDVADTIAKYLDAIAAEPHVGNLYATGITPEMIWGPQDAYLRVEMAAVGFLRGVPLDGAVAVEQSLVRLLGLIPTRAAFVEVVRRLRARNQETVRMALVSMARIAMYWSGPYRDRAVPLAPEIVDLDLVRSGLLQMTEERVVMQQAPHRDATLSNALEAIVLSLDSVPGKSESEWRRGPAVQRLLRERLGSHIEEYQFAGILAVAGLEPVPEQTLNSDGNPFGAGQRAQCVAGLLMRYGQAEAIDAVRELFQDPLAPRAGLYTLAPMAGDSSDQSEAARELIAHIVLEVLDQCAGFQAIQMPSVELDRLLTSIMEWASGDADDLNSERWASVIPQVVASRQRFCGEVGSERIRFLGEQALELIGSEGESLEVRGTAADVLHSAAIDHPGLFESAQQALAALSASLEGDESDASQTASVSGRFFRARLLAAAGKKDQAMEVLLDLVAEELFPPRAALFLQDDPHLRALVLREELGTAFLRLDEQRQQAGRPSVKTDEPLLAPMPRSDPHAWAIDVSDDFHAEWDYLTGDLVSSGWTRGDPILTHCRMGTDGDTEGKGWHLVLRSPGRSRACFRAEIPGNPKDLTLRVKQLAASSAALPFAGMTTVSLWINGVRVSETTLVNHNFEERVIPVTAWMQPGVNEIEFRMEGGSSAYWLRTVRLERTNPEGE